MNLSPEDMFVQRRLSGIARQLNGLIKNFEDFRAEHPGIIAPNVLDAIIGNLKDDVNVVMREMNMVASPNRAQLQQRRYVCRACHNVFMQPLVAGICDECRGRGITSAEVAADPEAEAEETDSGGEAQSTGADEEMARETPQADDSLPMIGENQAGADPFKPGYFERPEGDAPDETRD